MQDPSQTIAPASGGSSTPIVLQPTRSFTITGINQPFASLTASPDGRAVYVLSTTPAVNLWKSLVSHSPEILTVIGCLMTLLVLRRVAKRPQIAGERYCRQCNYLLKNQASDRCPECGGEATTRTIMRGASRKPRVALLVGCLAAFAVLYFCGALTPLRDWSAENWIDWRSTSLAKSPNARKWRFMSAGLDQVWSIDRIDLQTGALTVTPLDVRDSLRGMVVSDDGRSIAVWGDQGVYVYDWPQASLRASMRLTAELGAKHWSDRIMQARLSGDLTTAFVVTNFERVDRWTLVSQEATTLTSISIDNARYARLVPARDPNQRHAIVDPNLTTITLLPIEGAAETRRLPPPDSTRYNQLLLIPDSDTAILTPTTGRRDAPIIRSLIDGTDRSLQQPDAAWAPWNAHLSVDRQWLIVDDGVPPRDLRVWNMATGECAYRLAASGPSPIAAVIANNNTVVRLFYATPTTHQVDVFELTASKSN